MADKLAAPLFSEVQVEVLVNEVPNIVPLLKAIMAHNRPTAVAIAQQLARDHAFDALTYKDPHGNDALHLAFESGDEELIRAFKPIYGQFQPETVSALMQERTKPALNIWA